MFKGNDSCVTENKMPFTTVSLRKSVTVAASVGTLVG